MTLSRPRAWLAVVLGLALCLGVLGLPRSQASQPERGSTARAALPYAKRLTGYLTMPDGAQLQYSVLLPTATGRHPVAMVYNGYDAGGLGGTAWQSGDTWMSSELESDLVKHGYAVLGVQMRGTGCSSGTLGVFERQWGTDGARAVTWASRQLWSTGKVGMFEWSWPGLSQLFVASQRPKGLAAIAPGMVVTDPLRDVGAPGGVLEPAFPALWWTTIQDAWTLAGQDAAGDGDVRCAPNLARNLSQGQTTSPVTMSSHPYVDGFWRKKDLRSRTHRIDVPVLSLVDWQDEEVGARGGYYQETLDPRRTWVIGTNGQHDIYLSKAFRPTLLRFLDRYVKGRHNHFARTPHLRLWQDTTSSGGPQSSDGQLTRARPSFVVSQQHLPMRVRANRLFLTVDGTLAARRPQPAGTTTFTPTPGPEVNPDLVSATTGEAGGPAGEVSWTTTRQATGSYLSFTTPPMARTTTLAGSASLDLRLSSSLPTGTLQATVTEVRPGGREIYLQRGWLDLAQRAIEPGLSTPLRPVHRQTRAAERPLTPGRAVDARLEIPQFSHTFRRGSALRIVVDAPSGTGDWSFVSTPNGTDTITLGGDHASSVNVGVIRVGGRVPRAPRCTSLPGTPCRTSHMDAGHGSPLRLRGP